MTTHELLQQAYKLIRDRQHWTQLALARDKYNRKTPAESDDAVKFCTTAALYLACDGNYELRKEATIALGETIHPHWKGQFAIREHEFFAHNTSLIAYNDNGTHDQVCELFRDTIARTAPVETRDEVLVG